MRLKREKRKKRKMMNEQTQKMTTEERLKILESAHRALAGELDDIRRHVNDLREENARLRQRRERVID